MIAIDFQGGQHGNFLEYICNRFLASVPVSGSPFNNMGAAHVRPYLAAKQFAAAHYSIVPDQLLPPDTDKIISIRINVDDLLPLASISLLRAGDYGLDNDLLHVDTYNKLNNVVYRGLLDNLIDNFFPSVIFHSYDAIRDSSWPDVTTVEDFQRLPDHIRKECIEQHDFYPQKLTPDNPDCPRHILIEFFKIGFKDPKQSGFMTQQEKMIYASGIDVYCFPFSCFYNQTLFLNEIKRLADWCGLPVHDETALRSIHLDFLQRQPYKTSKTDCDKIFQNALAGDLSCRPGMNLLQESYLMAKLESYYGQDHFVDWDQFVQCMRDGL